MSTAKRKKFWAAKILVAMAHKRTHIALVTDNTTHTMSISKHPAVIATRAERDRLLRLVPSKPYDDCTSAEKMRFTNLEAANAAHLAACRAARQESAARQN